MLEFLLFKVNQLNRAREIEGIFNKYGGRVPYQTFRDELDARSGMVSNIFRIPIPPHVEQRKVLGFLCYEVRDGIVTSPDVVNAPQ